MKNVFTLLITTLLTFGVSSTINAQQEGHGNALNLFVGFGDNTSISGNYEFEITPDITVSPEAKLWFANDFEIGAGARADYYFDRLLEMGSHWDFWAGIDAGFIVTGASDFQLNIHIGGEYQIDDKWGIILEGGGGKVASGGLGVAIHL